ncbi:hypothetical protein GGP46_003018 [Salinibacter ruber]|nr:hypothetical protein [Salinibacter ruber]
MGTALFHRFRHSSKRLFGRRLSLSDLDPGGGWQLLTPFVMQSAAMGPDRMKRLTFNTASVG